MKSAKEIASKVVDKYQHSRQYPVGAAQQTILNALGVTKCNGHSHAQQIFDALGISVGNRREGRKSVPVVSKIGAGAARNNCGDYDVWNSPSDNIDLSAISEWMES